MNQYPPWRPIETAPKDNSCILLCLAGFEPCAGHFSTRFGAWCTVGESELDHIDEDATELDSEFEPTHWMPLPPTSTLDPI